MMKDIKLSKENRKKLNELAVPSHFILDDRFLNRLAQLPLETQEDVVITLATEGGEKTAEDGTGGGENMDEGGMEWNEHMGGSSTEGGEKVDQDEAAKISFMSPAARAKVEQLFDAFAKRRSQLDKQKTELLNDAQKTELLYRYKRLLCFKIQGNNRLKDERDSTIASMWLYINEIEARHKAENGRLRETIVELRKENADLKSKVERLEKELEEAWRYIREENNFSLENFLETHNIHSDVAKALISLQTRRDGSTEPYTAAQRAFCQQIFYYSARTYRNLRMQGLRLPAESTVRRWIGEHQIDAGINKVVMEDLKNFFKTLGPKFKICGLKFDEMTIRPKEEYNNYFDTTEGKVDLGDGEDTKERAKHLLVFSIDGLHAEDESQNYKP